MSQYNEELEEQQKYFSRNSVMDSERKDQYNHNSRRSKMIFLKVHKEAWDSSKEPIMTDKKGIRTREVVRFTKRRHDAKKNVWIEAREIRAIIKDPVQKALKEGFIKSPEEIDEPIFQAQQSGGNDPVRDLKRKAKEVQRKFRELNSRTPAEWEQAIKGLGMDADTILITRLVKLIWWDFVIWWEEDFSPEFNAMVEVRLKPDDYEQHDKKTLAMFLWKLGYPAYYANARTISL